MRLIACFRATDPPRGRRQKGRFGTVYARR